MFYPNNVALGKESLEIDIVFFPKDMIKNSDMTDRELLDYAKATYFGAKDIAQEQFQREFMGKSVTGDLQQSSIPSRSTLESYLIPLSNGRKMAVGFRKYGETTDDATEKVMGTIAGTIKETK
jgi:hypothetical protein